MAHEGGGVAASRDAAGGAGEDGAGGEGNGVGDGCDAAVGLDDEDGARVGGVAQAGFEAGEVALQGGADIGIHDRGADAVVFLDLGEDLAGEADIDAGEGDADGLGHGAFVGSVAPGVEGADGDGFDLFGFQGCDGGGERGGVEGDFDAAVGADAFAHAEAEVAGDELDRGRLAEVVAVVLEAFAHFDDVAVAFGGEQADFRALVFEEGVGGHCGAVDDAAGGGEHGGAGDGEGFGEAVEAFHDADGLVGGGGGGFGQGDVACFVDGDEVGEGAADVDSDGVHYFGSVTKPELGSVTKPERRSAARWAWVRAAGLPQPPPPPEWAWRMSFGRMVTPTSLVLRGRSGRFFDSSQ